MKFVCFPIIRVNFPQNIVQVDANENPGPGHWNPGQHHKNNECLMQRYVDH